ncbi:MAG: hypothetical protein ACLFRZ_09435, partial [Rhodosalinus sp.]
RQLGYLHAHVESGTGDKKKRDPKSRMQHYTDAGRPPPLVPLSAGQYLLEALIEAGPSKHDAMGGETALTWLDLWAYGQATQAVTEPWEFEALSRMSRAYVEGKMKGAHPLAKPPAG